MTHDQADEARALLAAHSADLRRQIRDLAIVPPLRSTYEGREFVGPSMLPEIERLEFVAGAIERFLGGDAKTLDEAFAVARPRQRPPAYVEMVARAIPLRLKRMPWKRVISEVGYRGSAEQFSKLYRKHMDAAAQLLLNTWAAEVWVIK